MRFVGIYPALGAGCADMEHILKENQRRKQPPRGDLTQPPNPPPWSLWSLLVALVGNESNRLDLDQYYGILCRQRLVSFHGLSSRLSGAFSFCHERF